MSFLKRSLHSLCYHWKKVLAHILAYSILFSLCFGAIMVYSTVRGQQAFLQGALQRAVTLRAGDYRIWVAKDRQGSMGTSVLYEDILKILQDASVEAWNTCTRLPLHIQDCGLLYADKRAEAYEKYGYGQIFLVGQDGMDAVCVRDSRRSQAFLTAGYQLVEGKHFSGDDPGDIIMVSEDFAKLNNLYIGDKVRVCNIEGDDVFIPFSGELTIIGIFHAPETSLLKGTGASPEETVVIPLAVRNRLLQRSLDSNAYDFATFYLKEDADPQAFMERLQADFPESEILDDFYKDYTKKMPEETIGMDWEEMNEYIQAHPEYLVQPDSQWYDMVAKPLDQEAKLAGAMLYLLLGSVVLIIALIVVLSIKERRREVGILLSMGESRVKVIGQLAVETALPILLALVLGIGIGSIAGVPLSEMLCNGVYEQTAADTQSENDSITFGFTLNAHGEPAELNERHMSTILSSGEQENVEVFPQAEVQADPQAMTAYVGIILAAALLALLAQGAAILTAKPARILLNRR